MRQEEEGWDQKPKCMWWVWYDIVSSLDYLMGRVYSRLARFSGTPYLFYLKPNQIASNAWHFLLYFFFSYPEKYKNENLGERVWGFLGSDSDENEWK